MVLDKIIHKAYFRIYKTLNKQNPLARDFFFLKYYIYQKLYIGFKM